MSFISGQTTYNIFPFQAVPGMLLDTEFNVLESYEAASDIYPGSAVELTSDGTGIQMCQDTGDAALSKMVGVAVLQTAREGVGTSNFTGSLGGAVWKAGDMVVVLQRGRIWGLWAGTTQVNLAVPNIKHSSTTPANQGVFTDASVASTSGSEVSAGPSWINIVQVVSGTNTYVALAVNFPGKY